LGIHCHPRTPVFGRVVPRRFSILLSETEKRRTAEKGNNEAMIPIYSELDLCKFTLLFYWLTTLSKEIETDEEFKCFIFFFTLH
jgi:hypothetical protein